MYKNIYNQNSAHNIYTIMNELVEKFVSACVCPWNLEVAKEAVAAGVDVNAENSKGLTALHVASGGCVIDPLRRDPILELLLLHPQIDVNRPSSGYCNWCQSKNSTPLHCACAYGHIDIMTRLLNDSHQSSINTVNSYGTPIMVAVDNWRPEAVSKMLRVEGVDIKTRNSWGRSLTQQARRTAHVMNVSEDMIDEDESLKLLQAAGAD